MSAATDHRAAIVASAPRNSQRVADAYAAGGTVGAYAYAEQLAGLARGMRAVLHALTAERNLWRGLIETGTVSGYALGTAQGHVNATDAAIAAITEALATVVLP